jgi:tRNA nucleotidyltransferase (CCA-adding enzyme)
MQFKALGDITTISRLKVALGDDAELYLVGGAVRDILLGKTPADLDFATILPIEEVERRLNQVGIRSIATGLKHGTITALIDEQPLEVTTFRKPLALSAIEPSQSIEIDLSARDFTINAAAISLQDFSLVDPYLAQEDLARGLLRAVGNPEERFEEDALRILRMIRFGVAEGRVIEVSTEQAAKKLSGKLSEISPERIKIEIEKILVSHNARSALNKMLELGILAVIIPEILDSVACLQNEFHIEDVFNHTLTVIERTPREAILRWTALFHDIGKPAALTVDDSGKRHFYNHEHIGAEIAKKIMQRLRFSNQEMSDIAQLVELHMRPLKCGAPGVRRILRDTAPNYSLWRTFKYADAPPIYTAREVESELANFDEMVAAEKLREQGTPISRLVIGGDELIQLGLKPGRKIGVVLKQLSEEVIEEPTLNNREKLLVRAKQLIGAD